MKVDLIIQADAPFAKLTVTRNELAYLFMLAGNTSVARNEHEMSPGKYGLVGKLDSLCDETYQKLKAAMGA